MMDYTSFTSLGKIDIRMQQKADYQELFRFAEECIVVKDSCSSAFPSTFPANKLPGHLLFVRAISHFRAAIITAEGGMAIEALTLCRGLIETAFVLNAFAKGAVSGQELISHDLFHRCKIPKALLASGHEEAGPHIGELKKFVSQSEWAKEISMYDFARRGNSLIVYNSIYSHLSHFAAHPSISSTEPFIEITSNNFEGLIQPALEHTPKPLLTACMGLILCLNSIGLLALGPEAGDQNVSNLLEKYERLYEQYNPWQQ